MKAENCGRTGGSGPRAQDLDETQAGELGNRFGNLPQPRLVYTLVTLMAWSPLGPSLTSNSTWSSSFKVRNPVPTMLV